MILIQMKTKEAKGYYRVETGSKALKYTPSMFLDHMSLKY